MKIVISTLLAAVLLACASGSAMAQAPPSCQTPQRLGVTFVIDDSNSMYGTTGSDPGFLRSAATRAGIDRLADGYVASVVMFGSDAIEVAPPTSLTPASRAPLKEAVQGAFSDRGNTDFDLAFNQAWLEHTKMPALVDRQAVVFLSDGLPSAAFSADTQFAGAGIPIFTLGLGADADETLMRDIAGRSGGDYYKLNSATDLAPVFAAIVSKLTCDEAAVQEGQTLAPGQSVRVPFSVGPDDANVQGLASWDTGDVSVKLVRPNGSTIDATSHGSGETFNTDPNYTSFALDNPRPGNWQIVLTAGSQAASNVNVQVQVFKRQGYIDPGAPQPDPNPHCRHTLGLGSLVTVVASCLRHEGDVYVADGDVRLNGIDLVAAPNKGKLIIDPAHLKVQATGHVEVRVGSIVAYNGAFDWSISHSLDIELGGKVSLKGFPLQGSLGVKWVPAGATITAHASLGPDFGEITGDVALEASNDLGVKLNTLTVSLKDGDLRLFNKLVLRGASLTYDNTKDLWQGTAQIGLPGGREVAGTIGIQNGRFHDAGATADNLNIPIGEALFVKKIGFDVGVNPLKLSGEMAVTAGPSLNVLGKNVSALEAAGAFSWTSGTPDTWTVGGDIKVASYQLGKGNLSYQPGRQISFGGDLSFRILMFGFNGHLQGWMEGSSTFQANGSGNIEVPGPWHPGAEVIVSSRGAAFCGKLFGSHVGAAYVWGGAKHVMAHSCDYSDVEVIRSTPAASGSQAGGTPGLAVTLGRSAHTILFAVHGAGGAPHVTVTGPSGPIIADDPSVGAVLNDRAYLLESPEEQTTYVIVRAPQRGRYLFSTTEGPALANVGTIAALPASRVRAHVRQAGGGLRRLTWSLNPIAGQRVRFVERGHGIAHTITTTNAAHGSVRFRPAPGPGGRRTIVAIVVQGQLPRAQTTVTSFHTAQSRPRQVSRIRVSRGKGLTVRWHRRGWASGYDVVVHTRQGARVLRVASGTASRARFSSLPKNSHGTVTVISRGLGKQTARVTKRF
jgi:hypothetical protein